MFFTILQDFKEIAGLLKSWGIGMKNLANVFAQIGVNRSDIFSVQFEELSLWALQQGMLLETRISFFFCKNIRKILFLRSLLPF